MSLEPFFSLSPNNPYVFTYDAAAPNAPWVSASVRTYGGYTSHWPLQRLPDQQARNQILLGPDAVLDTEQTISDWWTDFVRHCTVRVGFKGRNVSSAHQYLLVFRLLLASGSPVAQFFVGNRFLRNEVLTEAPAPYDDIAILLDASVSSEIFVHVRLAKSAGAPSGIFNGFVFKGVDCYLL